MSAQEKKYLEMCLMSSATLTTPHPSEKGIESGDKVIQFKHNYKLLTGYCGQCIFSWCWGFHPSVNEY